MALKLNYCADSDMSIFTKRNWSGTQRERESTTVSMKIDRRERTNFWGTECITQIIWYTTSLRMDECPMIECTRSAELMNNFFFLNDAIIFDLNQSIVWSHEICSLASCTVAVSNWYRHFVNQPSPLLPPSWFQRHKINSTKQKNGHCKIAKNV